MAICIVIIYIDELLVDHITQSLVAELAFPYWSLTFGESILYILRHTNKKKSVQINCNLLGFVVINAHYN